MKKFFYAFLAICMLTPFYLRAQTAGKRFLIKSGHIEMKLDGNTKGTKSIWFDQYGQLYFEETKATTITQVFGIKSTDEIHSLTLANADGFYSINLLDGIGTKTNMGSVMGLQEAYSELSESERKKFEEEILTSFGGERLGMETFLGKPCEIVKVMGSTSSIYKGLVLKSEIKLLGISNSERAVLFEENVNVPSSKFDLPAQIEIEDLGDLQTGLFEGMEGEFDSEEDEPVIPMSYPFEKFKEAVSKVSFKDFKKTATLNLEGEYMSTFMKSMTENFTIIGISEEEFNKDRDEEVRDNYQHFTRNGYDMHFGEVVDEEESNFKASALIIEYPSKNMVISIVSTPSMNKDEALKIADQLKF